MNVTQKGNKLVIELIMQEPKLSGSGKTRVVATTRGAWESPLEIEGKPVKIILNAFIDADKQVEGDEEEADENRDTTPRTKSGRRGAK